MLILGGEYNLFSPELWNAGVGFNMKVFDDYIQNDCLLTFGGIQAKPVKAEEPGSDDPQMKFLLSVRDNIYFTLEGKWVGLRAGAFASFGIYDIPDNTKVYDLFFNGGGLVGICVLPQSLVSVTIDVCPAYKVAFRINEGIAENESGFSLGLFLGIRFNFDKL
jgi:hypothetical protein